MEILDFGISDYGEVLLLQKNFFENLVKDKKEGREGSEYLLLGEHLPVITLGRRAKEENVLISKNLLKEKEIEVFHIGRGGDVTYHCRGQLIVYPILDLNRYKLGVKDYVYILEESIIRLIAKYKINGERVEGATGVWIGKGTSNERKICALGIKCSRYCSMHGIALNVNPDLSGFSMINPCGFQDKGVTSLEKELNSIGPESVLPDMKKIKKDFTEIFLSLLQNKL
ncbi:MAG: lipoyl(octanoyl) transferase LipB [Muribaculaceae bacterium]|nr:lipoyl(octanoyl) transferase LipB [Muribaculaceae bacterium]